MDTTSVGMADSERGGATPIFDELVKRFGLKPLAESIVSAPAGESVVEGGTRDEVVAAS